MKPYIPSSKIVHHATCLISSTFCSGRTQWMMERRQNYFTDGWSLRERKYHEWRTNLPLFQRDQFLNIICLVTQWYLTLCDPMDCGPPGSSVHGSLQARIQEWVAMPSLRLTLLLLLLLLSRFSCVRLCATPWTAAYQAPPPMGFSRQENWSGLTLPSP